MDTVGFEPVAEVVTMAAAAKEATRAVAKGLVTWVAAQGAA